MPNHQAIVGGVNVNGFWIEPVPERLVYGDVQTWADAASVKPARIPGYWIHKKGSKIPVGRRANTGEKVVLSLHGGAYTLLTGHPNGPSAVIGKGLLQHIDALPRVLSLEYRLSIGGSSPQNPFPAALLDALAAYQYLIFEMGFAERDVTVEGDSAGGNLALALTRYLVENQNKVEGLAGPPGGMVLLSPWSDFRIHDTPPPQSSYAQNVKSDYVGGINERYARGSVQAFVGPHGLEGAFKNRYMCPASRHPDLKINFAGFPRTFICGGEAEVLLDQIRILKDRMKESLGESLDKGVTYYEAKDCWHVHLYFPGEPERTNTWKAIAEWAAAARP
jgi:acetyl esterase/lipase